MVNYNINLFFFKFNEQKLKRNFDFCYFFILLNFSPEQTLPPRETIPIPQPCWFGRWPGGVSGSGWGVGSSGGLGSCQGAYGSCGVDSDCQVGGGGGGGGGVGSIIKWGKGASVDWDMGWKGANVRGRG